MLTILRMLTSKAAWLLLSFFVVVALLALWNEMPKKARDWRTQAQNTDIVARELRANVSAFERFANDAVAKADAELSVLKRSTDAELGKAESNIAERKIEVGKRVLDDKSLALAAVTGSTERITASYRAQFVELPLLQRASALISLRRANLRDVAAHRAQLGAIDVAVVKHNAAVAQHNRKLVELEKLRSRSTAQWRDPICRSVEVPLMCDLARRVKNLEEEIRKNKRELEKEEASLRARREAVQVLALRREQVVGGASIAAAASRAYVEQGQRWSKLAEGYVWNQAKRALQRHGWQAFLIVLGAALLPIAHKLFAFLVIAPMAQRSRPVRFQLAGALQVVKPSSKTVEVHVDGATELLLRSGLQSTAADIQGSDKYVLDWRMPLTCFAAGLFNLQRLRSDRQDYIAVTGTDEHKRVAVISVPAGGAIVLQPRALLGVAKARGHRLQIQRIWRIGWLISWITLQFRYVLFHGPCTLIVQGGNGVEVEDAARGRMINKRLTLGFDASLAYGAARSSSFLPYLRGEASLFNDRFVGPGHFVYEQRTEGGRRGSVWGRGLKGIGDAVLNAFGI